MYYIINSLQITYNKIIERILIVTYIVDERNKQGMKQIQDYEYKF